MPEDQSPNLRLDSWKSIAAYLGRDVRTVIRWEEMRGLPVRRMPGTTRSAVYALKHEIDAWMNAQPPVSGSDIVEAAAPANRLVSVREAPRVPTVTAVAVVAKTPVWIIRYWVQIAIGLTFAFLLISYLYPGSRASRRLPTRVVFTSRTLQAWDDANRLLWEYRFEQSFANTSAAGSLDPTTGRPFSLDVVNRSALYDLFGDGRREILAITVFPRGDSATDTNRQVLWCFDSTGKVLWSYEPQTVLKFGNRTYGPPWVIRQTIVSDEAGRKTIWATLVEPIWGKSFVARLDAGGHDTVQFVHSGEIHSPQGAMLWIGGFNDEYDTASVAIMRDTQQFAVSPQTPGSHYACVGCGLGDPYAYFVLPRYDLSRILHNPNNKVYAITSDANAVIVKQAEISESDQILYDFSNDSSPRPVRVNYSASFWPNHLELERQGKVTHSLEECPDRAHPPPVRVYQNGGWREVEVPSIFSEGALAPHSSR